MVYRRHKKTRSKRRSSRKRRSSQRGGAGIPHTVIQTSKDPIPAKVTDQLKKNLKGWEYKYFSDDDILSFLKENSFDEFPDITAKLQSFMSGEHRADLFRYYYLYIKGGVFMDSDLMLYDDMGSVLGSNTFVSVWALRPEGSVFNGLLAAAPKHPILYAALKDAYATTNEQLQADYTLFCKNLGGFVKGNGATGVKMLKELSNNDIFCKIQDPTTEKISLIHYQSMDIPDQPPP
jgi:mannosyltransferase OCH1-like enzyme